MAINLIVKPRTVPMSWKSFCKRTNNFSIALDGYVNQPPIYAPSGPRINFNHHEKVDRMATRSTCAQVLIAIRQGLFDIFRDDKGPKADVYVNDCDEDVCLSCFLLRNPDLVIKSCSDKMTRLVEMEDLLDATAGAYPMPLHIVELKEITWIFEPYRKARISGDLYRKEIATFEDIIFKTEERILKDLNGQHDLADIDWTYKVIGGGPGWSLIEEIGPHARSGAYADGIRAYVSVKEIGNNRWVYTIGKMSPFVAFDIKQIVKTLNAAEGNKRDRWGGANTIAGSPRVKGSKIPPEEIIPIINKTLETNPS